MKTQVIVNLSFWNEKIEVGEIETRLNFTVNIDRTYSDIQEELREVILENKIDGFQFDIYEFQNYGFIIVELFYGMEDRGMEINTDYLEGYFSSFDDVDFIPTISNDKSYANYITLRADENDFKLQEELKELNIEMEPVKTYRVYEWGAGDYAVQIIIGVLTNLGCEALLTFLRAKLQESYLSIQSVVRSDTEVIPLIKNHLRENHGISPSSLKFTQVMDLEDHIYVECVTRHERIKIRWTKKNGLKEIDIESFTETKI